MDYRTDYQIEWLSEVGSTNEMCMRRALSGGAQGLVVVADHQLRGRGQRGNVWTSEPGKNLTFSILLRPSFLLVERQFLISQVTAVALCRLVQGLVPREAVSVKWPNDIYIGSCKVAGVLIEHAYSSPKLDLSVVGIGLNVNQLRFPDNLPNPTSLALHTGKLLDLKRLLQQFFCLFNQQYVLLQSGDVGQIDAEYGCLLYRKGLVSKYISGSHQFTAVVQGVSPIGELLLRLPDGDIRAFGMHELRFVEGVEPSLP